MRDILYILFWTILFYVVMLLFGGALHWEIFSSTVETIRMFLKTVLDMASDWF